MQSINNNSHDSWIAMDPSGQLSLTLSYVCVMGPAGTPQQQQQQQQQQLHPNFTSIPSHLVSQHPPQPHHHHPQQQHQMTALAGSPAVGGCDGFTAASLQYTAAGASTTTAAQRRSGSHGSPSTSSYSAATNTHTTNNTLPLDSLNSSLYIPAGSDGQTFLVQVAPPLGGSTPVMQPQLLPAPTTTTSLWGHLAQSQPQYNNVHSLSLQPLSPSNSETNTTAFVQQQQQQLVQYHHHHHHPLSQSPPAAASWGLQLHSQHPPGAAHPQQPPHSVTAPLFIQTSPQQPYHLQQQQQHALLPQQQHHHHQQVTLIAVSPSSTAAPSSMMHQLPTQQHFTAVAAAPPPPPPPPPQYQQQQQQVLPHHHVGQQQQHPHHPSHNPLGEGGSQPHHHHHHPVPSTTPQQKPNLSDSQIAHGTQRQLMVHYLSPSINSTTLGQLFSPYGKLQGARIIYDRRTNQPRGFGFVYFEDPADAQRAQQAMNGAQVHGKWLKVEFTNNPLHVFTKDSVAGNSVEEDVSSSSEVDGNNQSQNNNSSTCSGRSGMQLPSSHNGPLQEDAAVGPRINADFLNDVPLLDHE